MSVCYYNAMVRIHGIDGPLLLWFRNFLPNGIQSVVLRVIFFGLSDAPQGTIRADDVYYLCK